MPSRLQLGVARLEDLDERVLDTFLDESWVHLGDSEAERAPRNLAYYARMFRRRPLHFLGLALREATGRSERPRRTTAPPGELYARADFREFYYQKGDALPFADEAFDYVFSEHFFHHLFFDEAFELFRECHRVLRPHGVIRTVVPDADLRTYAPPEPVGYPDLHEPFTSPLKHKTRYSVYLLSEALRLAVFEPVALRYCDREGTYVRNDPAQMRDVYRLCPEKDLVFDLSYVMRPDSLIVDGLKRPPEETAPGA